MVYKILFVLSKKIINFAAEFYKMIIFAVKNYTKIRKEMKTIITTIVQLIVFGLFVELHSQSSLDYVWAKQIGGEGYDKLSDMVIDTDNCIYSSYRTSSPTFMFDSVALEEAANAYLVKVDETGNLLWSFSAVSTFSIEFTKLSLYEGGIVATVNIRGAAHLGDTLVQSFSNEYTSPFIMKLSKEGNMEWIHRVDVANKISILGEDVDSMGNIYLTGMSWTPFMIINGDTIPTPGPHSLLVLKYDSNGMVLWGTHAGISSGYIARGRKIALDSENNIIVLGDYHGKDFIYQEDTIYNSLQRYLIFLKLSNTGEMKWVKLPHNQTDNFYATEFAINDNDEIFAIGHMHGQAYFDDISIENDYEQSFFVGINPDGSYKWVKSVQDISNNYPGKSRGSHVFTYQDNEVYFTGRYCSKVKFDNFVLFTDLFYLLHNTFLCKMTTDGEIEWVENIENRTTSGTFNRISVVNSNHDIYTSGLFSEFGLFGNDVFFSYGEYDDYLLKLSEQSTEVNNKVTPSSLNIYPNPASDIITIFSEFPIKKMKISFFSASGEFIETMTTDQNELNISHLSNGVYFVYFQMDKERHVRKLVKY